MKLYINLIDIYLLLIYKIFLKIINFEVTWLIVEFQSLDLNKYFSRFKII